jgi:hypothetical protein
MEQSRDALTSGLCPMGSEQSSLARAEELATLYVLAWSKIPTSANSWCCAAVVWALIFS